MTGLATLRTGVIEKRTQYQNITGFSLDNFHRVVFTLTVEM